MKTITKQFLVCLPIIVLVFTVNSLASARNPFEGQGELQRDIAWLYDSPLTVFEEIEYLGGGRYSYTYSFLNVDDKHIWNFGVYVIYPIYAADQTWDSLPEWSVSKILVDDLLPEYDPRNINFNLYATAHTWGPGWPDTTHPISPGDYVEGFRFIAETYDPVNKLYHYETVEDGYAHDTGYVAAIGYTQQISIATESTLWGVIKSLYR